MVAFIAIEMTMEYYNNVRMLGVPILGISVIYEDNMALIINVSIPGSNIKKKDHSCVYHFISEAGGAEIVCFIYKMMH